MIKYFTVLFFALLFITNNVFGQARSSIGFALGANHTLNKYDHKLNASFGLLGNIHINQKLAIEPSIALYEVSDYVSARLSAKYYATPRLFVTAGPFAWVGSDLRNGLGATVSAGYRIINRSNRNFELSLHGNFARYIYNSTPVVGIRAAYNFNFRKI